MGDFYTVPDAINFRNISTLGKNQSRTLLLKNLTCTDVVVFLNLPFTKQFSLECDSSIQHEQLNNATCVITRVPAGGTGKVEVRLHIPPDPKDAENLQDCLVVVMGNVPLLVPIRAVWQPLEPASGLCLQAILSQMNFYPPQKEIDEHCNAFMVELASKLQISLQPPRAQSQLSQRRSFDGRACSNGQAHSYWKAHTHKEAGAVDGRHSNSGAGQPPAHQQPEVAINASMQSNSHGEGSLAAGQQLSSLPPDTFTQVAPEQASGPVSSGEELQTSAEGATDLSMVPPIPKLDHHITIKGRTAYASRIPGTLSSAPLRQSSQPPSPSVPATAPAAHHNPPDNLQTAPSLPSLLASAPTAHRNLPDNLQTAPTLTSLPANALPAHLNSPDNHSSRTSAPLNPHNAQAPCATDGAQHPSKDHTLKAETAVRAGESRPSSSSSNSSSCKATPAGNGAAALCSHGSVEAAPAAASNFSSSKSSWRRAAHAQGGGMQAQGPVFLLDGRWFNARGEEVGAEDGVPGRDASSSMPPSLLSSLAPQGAAPLSPHMPRHAASYERPAALASAMRELGVHHLAPAPTSFASTATPFSSNGNFTIIQQSKQLHTMSGCLTQLDLPRLHPSALPRRSTSLTRSSSNSLHDARSSTGKKQGRVGVGPSNQEEAAGVRAVASESNKGRRSRDLADADDVEKDLESALEAHIAQLTDVGGSNALAPQSSSSTSSGFPQPSQHTQPDASNLSSKHARSTSVAGSSIPRTTQHTQPSTCDLSSWLTSSSSNTSMTGSSIPRPSQHTQPGVNDLSSRCVSGSSSTSLEGSSIPRPSQHTQPGVNDLSSRRASSRSSTSMAGSSKKPPSTVAHAKPNNQAAGTQIHAPTHATTHAATHATTHVKQPGRKTLPTCIPALRHPSSSNSKSTSAAHKDGTHNKGRSGPSTAAVGSTGQDESEEDDGDGFAEQLAQAIEAQIHTQAAHTAPPRPPLNTKRGTASGVHAAVKDDQVAPPRLGIPASHHTAKGAVERVRQQQNR